MSAASVEAVARALLYEGYLLYPYRRSAVKNRHRFNWGVLGPDTEPRLMRIECLVRGDGRTTLAASVRFLHLFARSAEGGAEPDWQEAVEREVPIPAATLADLMDGPRTRPFAFIGDEAPGRQVTLQGAVGRNAEPVADDVYRVSVTVENLTPVPAPAPGREDLLLHSLVSTHAILRLVHGEFLSQTDPPDSLREAAAACRNVGAWPVLAGEPGSRDTVLASPIIVSDYPEVAPESPGDFFDATEMDEMLTLRILTLTDEEKREMCEADERARQLLERTEACDADELLRLHGVLRPVRLLGEGP